VQQKLKVAALLRNDRQKLHNAKVVGQSQMLNRLDIRTEIIQVAEQADSNGALNAMNKLAF
jgi:hypothetical protein